MQMSQASSQAANELQRCSLMTSLPLRPSKLLQTISMNCSNQKPKQVHNRLLRALNCLLISLSKEPPAKTEEPVDEPPSADVDLLRGDVRVVDLNSKFRCQSMSKKPSSSAHRALRTVVPTLKPEERISLPNKTGMGSDMSSSTCYHGRGGNPVDSTRIASTKTRTIGRILGTGPSCSYFPASSSRHFC